MTRIITGTASVDPGGSIVTAWSNIDGVTLSEITAPASSTVVIEGRANFIKTRLSTTSFELMLPHAGDGGTGLDCAVSALTAGETQIGTLNARTATVIQQLGVLDANGRGLFYNLIGATGDNDPGPGRMAFNNADPELVTELYLDVLDANEGGRDVSGLIGLWSAGAVLVVRSIASTAYAAFQLNAAPGTPAGYRKVTCSFVGGDGTLAAEPVAIEWRLPGADKDVDATVPNLAGRALYDNAPAEFRVLGENVGGIAVRWTKLSGDHADWSAGARITGPAITLAVTEVDGVPYGSPPDVALVPRPGGYDMVWEIPLGMVVVPGTITTLAPDQPASWTWEPITGGYRVHLAIPRGPTGDIDGVAPFWVTRLGSDTTAMAARAGLELVKQTNVTDTTSGSLLVVGAFGVGKSVPLAAPNLDAVRPSGRYWCDSPTNGPGGNGWLDVSDLNADSGYHEFTDLTGKTFWRLRTAGAWTGPWTPKAGVPGGGTARQVLRKISATDGDAGWANAVGFGAAVNASSGASLDFTGIPPGCRRITLQLVQVSTNGNANYIVQLGSTAIQATGYFGAAGNTAATDAYTTGFGIRAGAGTVVMNGIMTLERVNGNTWAASGSFGRSDAASISSGGGSVTLAGELDRVRLTTVGGADAFDSGLVNITFE